MSRLLLKLRGDPDLPVDLRGVTPAALSGLTLAQVEQHGVTQGNRRLALADFFYIRAEGDTAALDEIIFEGELARFDRVGWQLDAGRIIVDGSVGDYGGACISGGELLVHGGAGMLAACEMAGGTLSIDGDAGDFAASGLPGSMDGMRGGTLIVRGSVGARFGDRMRRGTALVFGNAGDFLASRMVAGTIALGGQAGAHVGYGMRRGSLVFAGSTPKLPNTFVTAQSDVSVFWQLLARDLARFGGPFSALPTRRTVRALGDLSADGKGELIHLL